MPRRVEQDLALALLSLMKAAMKMMEIHDVEGAEMTNDEQ
jgi:hypothetical protein